MDKTIQQYNAAKQLKALVKQDKTARKTAARAAIARITAQTIKGQS